MALEAEGDKLVSWIRYIKISREALDGMEYTELGKKHGMSMSHAGMITKKVLDLAGSISPPIEVQMIRYCREERSVWHGRINKVERHVLAKLKEIGLAPLSSSAQANVIVPRGGDEE